MINSEFKNYLFDSKSLILRITTQLILFTSIVINKFLEEMLCRMFYKQKQILLSEVQIVVKRTTIVF